MSKKHKKHTSLTRPNRGMHHPTEWAIYGTHCKGISELYDGIKNHIEFSSIYIDADHDESPYASLKQVGTKRYINHKEASVFDFDDHLESRTYTYAIVNGNHYPASKQIVVINEQKKDSLHRRLDQLTDIQVVIAEDESNIYDFVKEKMHAETKIIHPNELSELYDFLREAIKNSIPKLKALILAGGASKRMGTDKSQIQYHNKPQEIYIAKLCKALGIPTYISKAVDYESDKIDIFPIIKDSFLDLGPMGAILSAFREDPNSAWLVIACDLPLLTSESIKHLIDQRNVDVLATAYTKSADSFPEPLISIYEPAAYGRLLDFLSLGYACPRKMLINSHVQKIIMENTDELMNANNPDDRAFIEKKLTPNGSV